MTPDTPLNNLPLPIVSDDGKPLEKRIKDVDGARSLYVKQRDADLESNRQMAKVQAMADGAQPYDPEYLRSTNQAYLSNFNPNGFKSLLDTSLAAYTDLISADEKLIDVFTTHGNAQEREQWSQIMSLHMSRAIRSWSKFYFQWALIPHYRTLHGVGIAYFEDALNWQWCVSNLALMKIPRQTPACEEDIEYGFTKSNTQPHRLMSLINKEEYAKEEGWNIPALKRALLNATTQTDDIYNWMDLEARWKNNDLVWGENNSAIPLIYGWVRENDGTYSILVFTENSLTNPGGEPEQFLCYKRGVYNRAQEAFVFFPRGIGTNGTFHSIRGLGADIYNAMQALMRLDNRKIDLAFAAGPIFQVKDQEKIESAMATPWGPFTMVTDGIDILQTQAVNVAQSIQPAADALWNTIQQNAGTYTSANVLDSSREMTKTEVLSKLEQAATLSVTDINLFNQSQDRLMREVGRRFTRKDYQRTDPGGHEVHDWRQACIEDGVPEEALNRIDHRRTRASRTIGYGSPAARRVAFQSIMDLFQEADDVGKQLMLRDLSASIVGWEKTNEYFPAAPDRMPVDFEIADLQNQVLASGGTAVISPSENKRVHLEVHTGKMAEIVAQFDEAGQNPEMFEQIVPPLNAIYEHTLATLEQYTGIDAPGFRQALQNVGEILVNGIRHIQKLERQQMEAQQREMEEGGLPGDPQQDSMTNEIERRVIENQVKIQMMRETHEAKRQEMASDAAQRRALKDLDAKYAMLNKVAQQQLQQSALQNPA